MGARDPYCGWDLLLKKCTTLEESVRMSQWEQSITKCPVSITELLPDLYIPHCSPLACYSLLHIHRCSSPFKVTACSVFSPCTHNLQATSPKTSLRNISSPKKGILGLNILDFKGAACTLGMIWSVPSIIHL